MKKFIKYIAIASGILLLIYLSFCAYFALQMFLYARSVNRIVNVEPAQIHKEVQQKIDMKIVFGQDDEVNISYFPWKDELTVFDLLTKVSEKNGIPIESKQYDFGIFVESIGGYKNTNEKAWIYFVNGKSGQVSADKQQVSPGDLIEWKYIKPEF